MRASTATVVSTTPKPIAAKAESAQALPDWASHPGLGVLQAWQPPDNQRPIGVAFSGGADSTALLLAAWHLWPHRVVALHVNHGLQAAAQDFEQHVSAFCAHWGVALALQRVQARQQPGDSLEAVAREARYPALVDMAQAHGLQTVLMAQHLEDQAETVLLALSRGAGLPGLAAMPAQFDRHGVRFVRPWLGVSGQALRAWLKAQGIPCVEDPTNADRRYTRNRIRLDVLPAWERAFPSAVPMLARTARHAAQAQVLLDEMAAEDLHQVGQPPAIRSLQALSPGRQANVLRFWLRGVGARQASAAQLQELQRQLADCTTRGHQIRLKVGRGQVLRQGASLVFVPAQPANL